ncbi:MAG: hypothetical protein ACKVG0_14950 [Alphaproteobacteria bacterium]|jgi:hypothetical protein|tara:strand:- start:327 stop:800 length:474 start_codon:yes stop_codon:yes gene_type:complete
MTVAVTVNPGSGTVITAVDRVGTINATVTAAGDDGETITNVTSTTYTGITMSGGEDNCTLIGTYEDGWTDIFTYVEQGYSNLNSTPTSITGTANLPDDKVVYDLSQDTTNSITKTYTITVSYEDDASSAQTPENFTVTHVINNTWTAIYNKMDTYYD